MSEFFLDPVVFVDIIRNATLPGAAGGLVAFLLAYLREHYRNNKHFAKAMSEIVGGMIVASFLAPQLFSTRIVLMSFLIGVSWSMVIQAARTRITQFVEVALGDPPSGRKEGS